VDQFFPRGKLVVLWALVPVLEYGNRIETHNTLKFLLELEVFSKGFIQITDKKHPWLGHGCLFFSPDGSNFLSSLSLLSRENLFHLDTVRTGTQHQTWSEKKLLAMNDAYHPITNTFKHRRNFQKEEHSDIINIHGSLRYKYIQLPRSLQRKRVRG
jgi:hypothetical protein